jgi:glycerate kinase
MARRPLRVLAALDKFRGTATAAEACAAVAQAGWEVGADVVELPMSDGGEGILDALGGANRTTTVTGPLGTPVHAGWRLDRRRAIIEMATASGLLLAGGAEGNDPLNASTRGTGELIDHAAEQGARTIVVGLGGSATTDGGLGAIEAMRSPARFKAIDLQVACDVRTRFVDAAAVFAPQKGASPAQVALLTARLEQLADRYRREFGVDVRDVDGSGAAGGLAGGLLAIGGRILSGFEVVADHLDLDEHLESVDVVVTGEGYLDRQSLDGKVVGGVAERAVAEGKPVVIVAGDADGEAIDEVTAMATGEAPVVVTLLVERFGSDRALNEPQWCIEHAVADAIRSMQ